MDQDSKQKLAQFYYGEFSFDKLVKIREFPNVHIYAKNRWPGVHNFIGTATEEDMKSISKMYSEELKLE